jgi:hypothetical protein
MKSRRGFLLFTLVVAISSCKKTVSNPGNPLTNYFLSLQVGKYATYRLDSLNFYFYGQLDTITSYLAKDSVEKSFVDGSGHTAWLVTRYLSDTTGSAWAPSLTYTVTPSAQNIEVTENNLRYIKLAYPMDEGFSWTGNTYLPYNPFQDYFVFSDVNNLDLSGWNYTWQQVNKPFQLASGVTCDSTATVLQINDSTNLPIFASRTWWTETYAKHIGLIYRHTEMWEYQPPTPDGTQAGYKIGFELTMSLVDHN